MSAPKDYRGFAQVLSGLGAAPVRRKGSHEQWRLQDGRVYTLHLGREYERRTALNYWRDLRRLFPQLREA